MLKVSGIVGLSVLVAAASPGRILSPLPLPVPSDPCAAIAGQLWVSPQEARECLLSFPVDPVIKANTLEVITKTLAFHTSVNYQIQAPPPFEDTHEDLFKDLARINEIKYDSELAFHLDVFAAFRGLNDGHCVNIDRCYDSAFVTYIPLPLVLLSEPHGAQNVYIAPEAYEVASAEFKDEIEFWQNALPGELRGQLESLSGAQVLLIDGQDPFVAVNAYAENAGGYQGFGTRQNSFFSSYSRGSDGWNYTMGGFASKIHPLTDHVILTLRRTGKREIDVITLPYRSRRGSTTKEFTDSTSFRSNNCVATGGTNGRDLYHPIPPQSEEQVSAAAAFQQQPWLDPRESQRHYLDVMLDAAPLSDIDLPEHLQPALPSLNESYSVAQFYMLDGINNQTGVLALGSFSASNYSLFQQSLLEGLVGLKSQGATNLIVDVTNNGGGYICIAHWLHRIIVGPKRTTEPQAGLDTALRAGPLAQLIVQKIVDGADPDDKLMYNPLSWRNASNIPFEKGTDWIKPLDYRMVNGHEDAFSQRLGQECQPFEMSPPDEALFDPRNVVIVSNGRCASSCSLFSITMSKLEGVKTVVVGGKQDVPQQYCGIVGGQSTDFSTIDTQIKSAGLKNNSLAPPDFLGNIVQGITWRLGFGLGANSDKPEEWQDHQADFNMPLTAETVNNPVAIWNAIAGELLQKPRSDPAVLVVQSA